MHEDLCMKKQGGSHHQCNCQHTDELKEEILCIYIKSNDKFFDRFFTIVIIN